MIVIDDDDYLYACIPMLIYRRLSLCLHVCLLSMYATVCMLYDIASGVYVSPRPIFSNLTPFHFLSVVSPSCLCQESPASSDKPSYFSRQSRNATRWPSGICDCYSQPDVWRSAKAPT